MLTRSDRLCVGRPVMQVATLPKACVYWEGSGRRCRQNTRCTAAGSADSYKRMQSSKVNDSWDYAKSNIVTMKTGWQMHVLRMFAESGAQAQGWPGLCTSEQVLIHSIKMAVSPLSNHQDTFNPSAFCTDIWYVHPNGCFTRAHAASRGYIHWFLVLH
ncbi:hypothetical protein K431DRAFT_24229 [Polychaeton citri CBS 116435]|uniref:Uncharacterized protein n=1 Tax=Polychaeton citri CBS 116435 TaxID=1314669 RepID=A0A9P4QF44_9PEZI|nr:hypothetical protein K431DRAFT_24229 [Polychaeton citri CBS 116435]